MSKKARPFPLRRSLGTGFVLIGNAGGDFKGGKGRMYALDAKSGKSSGNSILVPKEDGDMSSAR